MSEPFVLIKPASRWRPLDVRELAQYRELLYFLVWRDLKVRFKQTALGVAWILLRPLLSVGVFAVVFGRLAKMPSDGVPYSVFAMIAMVPWTYFASALAGASQSLVSNASLITKVYVPRVLIPVAVVVSNLVEVVITVSLALALMLAYGVRPSANALWAVPALLLLTSAMALGFGLWLGAMNVRFRDVGNAIPFVVQVWMYATPIVYPMSLVPARWRWVAGLNPMTGVVDAFRGALLSRPIDFVSLSQATGICVVVLVSGVFFFRSIERTFADTV